MHGPRILHAPDRNYSIQCQIRRTFTDQRNPHPYKIVQNFPPFGCVPYCEPSSPLVVFRCFLPPFNRKASPFGCGIALRGQIYTFHHNHQVLTGGRFAFIKHI